MSKYNVRITNAETAQVETQVETDGVVLLYLEQGKLSVVGKIELSVIAPYIAQMFMEKIVK